MNKRLKFSIALALILALTLTTACASAGTPSMPAPSAPSEERVAEEGYPAGEKTADIDT